MTAEHADRTGPAAGDVRRDDEDARRLDFTIEGYRALLQALLNRGYACAGFSAELPDRSAVILRHDIDVSIPAALEVAKAEAALGVTASYFVLIRSGLYSAFSKEAVEALFEIRRLGHEIGLHLDASLYESSPAAIDRAAEFECGMLERIVDGPIEVVSFHRPAPELVGSDCPVAGRLHTYMPRFMSDIAYRSDSRGEWGHGHPLDSDAVINGRTIQLLTHPIWWCRKHRQTPAERLRWFHQGRSEQLGRVLAREFSIYR